MGPRQIARSLSVRPHIAEPTQTEVANEEEEAPPGEETKNDGLYKGAGNYQKFHLKREVITTITSQKCESVPRRARI